MNAAAVLRVIVEAQIGTATAEVRKFNGELEASAAKADAAMTGIANSAKKAELAGKRMETTGRSITKAGKAIGLAAAPMALFGAASVKMSLNFRRQMGLVATDAGGTAKEVHRLEHSVLGLSRASQYGPTQLAESLFHVESSGYRGAKAMRVLNEAQKLATTGNSDLQTTTYALISATKSLYGDSLTNVNRTAAELNGIVAHGDMRLEELTAAMATGVIPKAKAMGLDLRDVGAAMDVMTARGIPAQRAAYALGFTMQKLVPYGEKAEDAFKSIGLGEETLVKAAKGPGGYVHTLEVLQHHLTQLPTQAKQTKLIEEMFGGGRMTSGLLTDLQNLGEMRKIYGELGHEVGIYSRHVKEAEEQPLVKIKRAWASVQASMTEIGGDLLPIIVPGFEHLVHIADGAMHVFTGMPPELQSAAVEAGLVGIGLAGALIMTGKLIEAVGILRGSMMATATINIASSVAGGLGDLRAASALAMGGEMGGFRMLGSDAAGALMGGMRIALPGLAAAAGLGDMIYTATQGDWGKVGAEAGGAVVGGIAGAFVGNPLLGAGLGAIVGGLGDDLAKAIFGGGSSDKLANFQSGLSADMHRLSNAAGVQKEAFLALANAGHKVAAAHHRVHAAESRLKASKESLKQTEESFKGTRHLSIEQAIMLARKEENVRRAAHQVAVAKRAEDTAERLQGIRRKITRRQLEQTVEVEKGIAERRAKQIGPLKHLLQYEEDQGASRKRIIEIGQTLIRDIEAHREAVMKVNRAENEAATEISPKFAKHLENIQSAERQITEGFRKAHAPLELTNELFSRQATTVKRVGRQWEDITHVMGPFQSTTHSKLGLAMADAKSWSEATKRGVTDTERRFHSFASKLGVANVHFHVEGGGQKAQGRQDGGFIVPGTGSGDRDGFMGQPGAFVLNREATAAYGFAHGGYIPLALEPGERYFSPPEVAAIGPHNLAAMNSTVRRFQKGGSLGPEPQLAGPMGSLQAVGQAAIHQVYQGAQQYLNKHSGGAGGVAIPGGGGSVIAQIARVLFANGFNKIAAAGIIGNAYRESLWNPGAVGTGGGGLWGFTSGAISLAALQAAAKRGGVPWTNVPFQTGFMLRHGGMGLRGALNSAGSAGNAARIFMEQWERPGIPALGEREAAARRALAMGYQRGGPIGLQSGGSVVLMPGVNMSVGKEPEIRSDLKSLSDRVKKTIYVISGYRSPEHSIAVGGFSNDPHTRGEAADIGVGSASRASAGSLSERVLHAVNLDRPFYPQSASEINHVQLWHGSSGASEGVPGVYRGAHTHSLSFGSLPKSLHGVEREIKRREHELRTYRRAAASAPPATKTAIQHNITALEKRLRELRRQRHKLRQEAAKRRVSRNLGRRLGKITGYEKLIEGKQRAYNIANEFASQVVDLEPQEATGEAAEQGYLKRFEAYIEGQERPAFQHVLETEADWRDTILRAQFYGFGKKHPSTAGMERTWEKQIRKIEHQVESIKKHPKDKKGHEQLPMLRYKERELRKALGEARGAFYPGFKNPVQPPGVPLAGTGTFEDDLIEVQGTHWPDQHGLISILPAKRVAGLFGGAIWDTQGTFEELGLKVSQAGANASGTSNSEREQLLEELLLQARQREAVSGAQSEVANQYGAPAYPYMGAFAEGGVALVGDGGGPELAHFPSGTRIHSASDTERILSPKVVVHIYEGTGKVAVEVDDKLIDGVVNHRKFAPAAVRAVSGTRGAGLRTPGGL